MMKYSLSRIAEELGVSKATVSQVLNGKARSARISEQLEKRIVKFCREVNYVPNIHARRINRKYSNTLGFLINRSIMVDNDNPFADYNLSSILGGAVLAAEDMGLRVIIQLYRKDMEDSCVFEWFRNQEIDGLIYYGLDIPEKWRRIFIEEHRSIVGIGIEAEQEIATVNIDNFRISEKLTEKLIADGRKKFMYLSGIDGSYVSDERKKGFLSALNKNGMDMSSVNVISAKFSEGLAEKTVFEHISGEDAIICANDDMAIGAIKALKKLKKDIPKEIAVAGADNVLVGRYTTPSLTTFDNRQHDMGEEAVKLICKMIKGKKTKNIVLPSEIIVREST